MSILRCLAQTGFAPVSRNILCGLQTRGLKQTVEEKLGLPKKPKRPSSIFVKFVTKERANIAAKNPNAKPKEILSLASELWKNTSEATKNNLNDQYKREFEEYTKQLEKYNSQLTSEQAEELEMAVEEIKEQKEKKEMRLADNRRKKDLGKPTKPLSSYLLFAMSEKGNRGDMAAKDFQLMVSQKWLGLSEQEKSKWVKEAAKGAEEYNKKLDDWEKRMLKLGNFDVVRKKTLEVHAPKNAGKKQ